jgi:hypothetical protein
MIKVEWVIEWASAGEAVCSDTEAAASALIDAVRGATEPHGDEVTGRALYSVVGPLRAAMVTDGRAAIERGEQWSATLGGISVSLSRE